MLTIPLNQLVSCVPNVFHPSILTLYYKKYGSIVYLYNKDKSRNNYYTLTYSTKDARKILDKLYTLGPGNMFLLRKYEKYRHWLERNRIYDSPHCLL